MLSESSDYSNLDFLHSSVDDSICNFLPTSSSSPTTIIPTIGATAAPEKLNTSAPSDLPGQKNDTQCPVKRKRTFAETHPLQPSCTCKRKCVEKINNNRRKSIHVQFCSMNRSLQEEFIFQRVNVVPKRRSRTRGSPKKQRNNTRIYTFVEQGENIQVCSKFFLGTLGYKKDNVISSLLSKQSPRKSRVSSSSIHDQRGRHQPAHKMSVQTKDTIKSHINSYHPSVSHYRRKHAPLRIYLPPGLSVAELYRDFTEKHADRPVAYESYRKIFKSMNISFAKLGEEECEDCEEFNHHECSEDELCNICEKQKQHIERAKESRAHYKEDALSTNNPRNTYFSMDMQKILMLPHFPGIKKPYLQEELLSLIKRLLHYDALIYQVMYQGHLSGTKQFRGERMRM